MKTFFLLLITLFTFFQGYVMPTETATFAGGCFWCLQHDFDELKGVISTSVGYTGGITPNPSYEEVCAGNTGHLEAIEVVFDPLIINYQDLLNLYWDSIEPTRDDGQFCDTGEQYKPAIFYHNETQRQLAETSKAELALKYKVRPILVQILPAEVFYAAEDYHQKYYKKSPVQYNLYRYSCRLKKE